MFARVPVVARTVRRYPTSSESLDFLSGLMKRIDKLNSEVLARKKDQQYKKAQGQKADGLKMASKTDPKAKAKNKMGSKEGLAFASKNGRNSQNENGRKLNGPVGAVLGTKDHPMLSNRFQKAKKNEKNYSSGSRKMYFGDRSSKSFQGLSDRPDRNRQRLPKFSEPRPVATGGKFIDARPQVKQTNNQQRSRDGLQRDRQSSQRTSRLAGSRADFRAHRPQQKLQRLAPRARSTRIGVRVVAQESVVRKQLVSKPLAPSITGDHFIYGKPASSAFSLLSRVSAITKRTLLESKYPYKMPRSIIDDLPVSPRGGRFILQKDFSTDVELDSFVKKVKHVVKGETEQLEMGKKPSALASAVGEELMRNASLNMEQKQRIFNLVTGAQSAEVALKNAPWK